MREIIGQLGVFDCRQLLTMAAKQVDDLKRLSFKMPSPSFLRFSCSKVAEGYHGTGE